MGAVGGAAQWDELHLPSALAPLPSVYPRLRPALLLLHGACPLGDAQHPLPPPHRVPSLGSLKTAASFWKVPIMPWAGVAVRGLLAGLSSLQRYGTVCSGELLSSQMPNCCGDDVGRHVVRADPGPIPKLPPPGDWPETHGSESSLEGPSTHLIRLDLCDQILEGREAAQPHHGLGLLHRQALDLGGGAGVQDDLLAPQEVLELGIVRGLSGGRAVPSQGLRATQMRLFSEGTAQLQSLPRCPPGAAANPCDSVPLSLCGDAKTGKRQQGSALPGQALELDPGQQHGKGDVVLVQHAPGHPVKRHLGTQAGDTAEAREL